MKGHIIIHETNGRLKNNPWSDMKSINTKNVEKMTLARDDQRKIIESVILNSFLKDLSG